MGRGGGRVSGQPWGRVKEVGSSWQWGRQVYSAGRKAVQRGAGRRGGGGGVKVVVAVRGGQGRGGRCGGCAVACRHATLQMITRCRHNIPPQCCAKVQKMVGRVEFPNKAGPKGRQKTGV